MGVNLGNETKSFQDPKRLIGIDESGKGDYFGPLVIAGVYTDENTSAELQYAGVTDSKKITDHKAQKLAKLIKNICPYDIVIIENERYNDLYASIKNLNKLLAWGHARVIENLLDKVDCDYALSDQFGRPELIQKALMTKGRQIRLEQRPKAEENIAVAAASILARDEFVSRMNGLESRYGFSFPKGASSNVVKAAKEFTEQFGRDSMNKVAKLHFKITNQI
ncbi:MAG TPA: ribonuclease HIII [Clostridiales bacterium]|nr:ribonuclease HIII [Clostridiales bacterium]